MKGPAIHGYAAMRGCIPRHGVQAADKFKSAENLLVNRQCCGDLFSFVKNL